VHEEWTDKLSDYLDGELSADERRAVDAHLKTCAECAAVLDDLERIVARAQGIADTVRPPSADLWPGVASRIEASRRVVPLSRRRAAKSERRISFTLPQLAAAAALVAAVSGGLVWSLRPARVTAPPVAETTAAAAPEPQAAGDLPPATADRVVPVGMADAQYDAAVSDLERAVKQGRGRLDASTIAIVEHNLQIIDQAIDQAREALAADPVNTYLSGHLVEARRRKLELLRRAAALTAESN
jgi:anti-sigma factor RsiW